MLIRWLALSPRAARTSCHGRIEITLPPNENGFVPLFNGIDLAGWTAQPRQYGNVYPGGPRVTDTVPGFPRDYNDQAAEHPAVWTVEDGAIVGRQDAPGSGWGGYLVSNDQYGDFELRLEMKPDWPADTGIMVRRRFDDWAGLQVLVDHRQSGSIGGFFGNGLARIQGIPFALTATLDQHGAPIGLAADDPHTSVEPFSAEKARLLSFAGDVDEFLAVWRWNDWNELTVRCVGNLPTVTSWVNKVKVAEIDLSQVEAPNFRPEDVAAALGNRGHIAFEVHDNDPILGARRWAPGAACRWRAVRLRVL